MIIDNLYKGETLCSTLLVGLITKQIQPNLLITKRKHNLVANSLNAKNVQEEPKI